MALGLFDPFSQANFGAVKNERPSMGPSFRRLPESVVTIPAETRWSRVQNPGDVEESRSHGTPSSAREEENKSFGRGRVCKDCVAQCRVRQAAEHRGLNDGR